MIKCRDEILREAVRPNSIWIHRISRLFTVCLEAMASTDNQESLAPFFRFIEVYTSSSSYVKFIDVDSDPSDSCVQPIIARIFEYQMSKNYFRSVRKICDAKIPPIIAETTKAPTPVCESILDMILKPLAFVNINKEFG